MSDSTGSIDFTQGILLGIIIAVALGSGVMSVNACWNTGTTETANEAVRQHEQRHHR